MTPTVRPLQRSDVEATLVLWQALNQNGRKVDPRWRLVERAPELMARWAPDVWLQQRPFPRGWVAIDGERVVGFLEGEAVAISPILDQPPTALIANLFVQPDARRSGVGRALVARFAEATAAAGFPVLEVGTLAADARAVGFWHALGFGDWRVILRRE